MPKSYFRQESREEVRAALRELDRQHPSWARVQVKREYRRRTGRGGKDWMAEEAERAKAKLADVNAEVRRLARAQEAHRT